MKTAGSRKLWGAAAVGVALALLGSWHLLAQLHDALHDAHPTRDNAIYEINVRRVLEGAQWSGPHSQGFRHPGPSFFYLLALGYVVAGKTTFSLYAAAQLLTVATILGCALVVSTLAKSPIPALFFVPLLLLEMAYLGDYPLYDFWPPYVLFFCYALLLALSAAVAAGRGSATAPLFVTATLLVQTHVSYAPAVIVALAFAGIGRARTGVRLSATDTRHLGWAVLVTALLWAQPVYAELGRGVGNFQALRHVFFETEARDWPVSRLIDRVSLELSGPWQFALFGDRFIVPEAPKHYAAARWIAAAEVVALLFAWRRARRKDEPFSRALCALCLVSIVVAVWSVRSIRFEVAPHHTAWISILGFMAPIAALGSVAIGSSKPQVATRLLGVAAAWTASVFLWPIRIIPGVHVNPEVPILADALTAALHEESKERPLVTWESQAEYDWAVAVMLELEKRRVRFSVQGSDTLDWMIGGPRWDTSVDSSAVATFTVARDEEQGRKLECVQDGADYFMRYPVCAWLRVE